MLALALKLTLAPALVALATAVARRAGPHKGGLVSGLPVVAGPILLILAVQQGTGYAHEAAAASVLGMISLVAFCVLYATAAPRCAPGVALLAGAGAFAAGTLLLLHIFLPLVPSASLAMGVISGGAWLLRQKPRAPSGAEARRGSSDLLTWRVLITAVMVLTLTSAARGLSAHLAGLLTPFPIITAVMAVFTQSQDGSAAVIVLLGGLVRALVSYLAFFIVAAALLGHLPLVPTFGLATLATLVVWGAVANVGR